MSGELSRLDAALADRYRLERELGQGGMATVYLAHDVEDVGKPACDRNRLIGAWRIG